MSNQKTKLLSVKEVAQWFGVNPMTIYRKAQQGKMPALKFGKHWLFPQDVLEEWISSQIQEKATPLADQLKQVEFSKLKSVFLVYFFGSASTGDNTALSDIDLAYLGDDSVSCFDLEAEIEQLIYKKFPKLPRLDLVNLNKAPISIRYRAIKDGQLIYQLKEEVRGGFEERVINEYLDYEIVLKRFYKEVA